VPLLCRADIAGYRQQKSLGTKFCLLVVSAMLAMPPRRLTLLATLVFSVALEEEQEPVRTLEKAVVKERNDIRVINDKESKGKEENAEEEGKRTRKRRTSRW